MKLQTMMRGLTLIFGGVLIWLSFHVEIFWSDNSIEYFNVQEAARAYGALIVVLGCVLIILKNVSCMQFFWLMWLGMMVVRVTRLLPNIHWESHIMNSPVVFWITIGFGCILTAISIGRRMYRIF